MEYSSTKVGNETGNSWSSRNPYRRETIGTSQASEGSYRAQATYVLPTLQGQPTGASSIRTGATAFPTPEKSGGLPLSAEDGWATCLKVMTDYDNALIQGWNENIDGLLILSALISGVVTTFAVEFYTLLQPDSQGPSDALLVQISSQLAFIVSNGTILPSTTSTTPSDPGFTPTRSAVYINTLWFMSLTLSLLTAVWGLLVRQWLAKTPLHSGTAVRARVRSHQKRHAALVKWRVGQVVAFLPILLQVSVALFLAGLVQLLWTLNPIVAGFVTIPVTLATAGLVSTMILPALADDCPYRSPLSSQITELIKNVSKLIRQSFRRTKLAIPLTSSSHRTSRLKDVGEPALVTDKAALEWTQSIVTDGNLIRGIMPCLAGLDREAVISWVAQERNIDTRELVIQIRENQWRESSKEFGDLIGKESLLSLVFSMINDTADDTPGLGISRMDIVGLFAHLVNEVSPTSHMIAVQYMDDLLPALADIDLRAHHSALLSKFIHGCISRDYPSTCHELAGEPLLQWALRIFRQLGPLRQTAHQAWGSQEQHAFEYAAAAAITAVSSGASLPRLGSHQQAQLRRLLVALAFFFEHTTLQCPSVDWFPTLRRLFDDAQLVPTAENADMKELRETVEAVHAALESLVSLYRGRWIDRLNGIDVDLQYGLLYPLHVTRAQANHHQEVEEEWDSDAILGVEIQSIWTGS